jgi:hypothetical protein
VDFVVIAGDLYDGDWLDFNTGLFFARGMAQLGESGIAVYVLRGNHDAASRLTLSLPLPKNVRLFSHSHPETFLDENLGLAIHGQSFATAAVVDDLAAGYPQATRGHVNIGVLHTSLTGRPGHHPYGPTTEAVLRSKGYDYWALGHVHAREVVLTDPWVVYPGNLQGRHVREPGAKGCELVTIVDGRVATKTVALDVLRWKELTVEVSDVPDVDAVLERAAGAMKAALAQADGRILGVRMQLRGAGVGQRVISARPEVIEAQLRNLAVEVAGGRAWVEKVRVQLRPALKVARLAAGDDPVGLMLRELRGLGLDRERLAALVRETLQDVRGKLPAELGDEDALGLTEPADLEELLREVEGDLLARLRGGEAG